MPCCRFLSSFEASLAPKYQMLKLQRPRGKQDGVAILVHRDAIIVSTHKTEVGRPSSRVVLIAHVRLHGKDVVIRSPECYRSFK